MRACVVGIIAILCVAVPLARPVLASNIAFDTSSDSAYNNGWTQGSNGGFGWGGGWQINGDYTLPQPPIAEISADPSLGGIMNSPAVGDGRAWAIAYAEARRPLAGPLAVGQTISVDLDGAGIEFHSPLFAFALVANRGSDFMLGEEAFFIGSGLISYIDTGIPVINGPIALSLTMQDNYSFTFDVRSLASPATGGSYSFQFASDPDQTYLAGREENGTTAGYANNLSVTPEPSGYLFASVAAIGLLRRRTRLLKGV